MEGLEKVYYGNYKKIWIAIILILFMPVFLVFTFSFLFFGNFVEIIKVIIGNRNNLTFNADAYPTLSEVIDYTVAGYSIIITGIFSYVLLKTSVRGYEVAEAVKSLEENRDKEIVRQNALIIYYELLTGYSNLRELYISVVLEGALPNPNRMFFQMIGSNIFLH